MFERLLARIGTLGAILILAFAVLVVGFGGGVVEHLRLTAQQQQPGEQNGSQDESEQGDQGEKGDGESKQSGKKSTSQEGDNGSQAGQKGEKGESETEIETEAK